MPTVMDFRSDLASQLAPEVLDALKLSAGHVTGLYGTDDITVGLTERFIELFEHRVAVFPVLTGTAGNAIALTAANPDRQAVLSHVEAHIMTSEGGSVEFFNPGTRVVGVAGADGRVDPDALLRTIEASKSSSGRMRPSALTLTQATEAGTVYPLDALRQLTSIAKSEDIKVHMDGARMLNAATSLGVSLADLTWRSGADIVTIGFAKNGGGCADAIACFDMVIGARLAALAKRSGQIRGRMQLLSAQIVAALDEGRCMRWARKANEMASLLATTLARHGYNPVRTPEINEVFVRIPSELQVALHGSGAQFYLWREPDLCRFVTSYATSADSIESLAALVGG